VVSLEGIPAWVFRQPAVEQEDDDEDEDELPES
jgi:hypothetical protein